jgi:hypothetical protein
MDVRVDRDYFGECKDWRSSDEWMKGVGGRSHESFANIWGAVLYCKAEDME